MMKKMTPTMMPTTMPAAALVSFVMVSLLLAAGCKNREAPAPPAPPAAVVSPQAPVQAPVAAPVASAPVAAAQAQAADPCPAICARTAPLACAQGGQCLQGCASMRDDRTCPTQMRAFFTCLLTQPVTHFECDSRGMAALKDGHCDKEQAAIGECLQKALQ